MTWIYRELDKPLAWRMGELLQSLLVLRDSLRGLHGQQLHQIIPLSGQLRALLTERSGQADPLLRKIADLVGQDLTVYAMPGHEQDDLPIKEKLAVHIKGFPLSVHPELPAQRALALEELLKREIVLLGEKKYTVGDVINWFANKAGGAHYSRRLPEDFAQLLQLPFVGSAPIASSLHQLGRVTFELGRRLLKRLVDFEIHFLLAIPPNRMTHTVYLLDAVYPNTGMRLWLQLRPLGKPEFGVRGLHGQSAVIATERLLDWTLVRHVHVRLCIAEDLDTEVEILVDGDLVASGKMPFPIFIASDISSYEVYLNRPAEGGTQQFEFGLAEMTMFGAEHRPLDHAKLNAYFDERRKAKDLSCVVFTAGSWGHAPKGTNDQQMHGVVLQRNAWEYLGVEPP